MLCTYVGNSNNKNRIIVEIKYSTEHGWKDPFSVLTGYVISTNTHIRKQLSTDDYKSDINSIYNKLDPNFIISWESKIISYLLIFSSLF